MRNRVSLHRRSAAEYCLSDHAGDPKRRSLHEWAQFHGGNCISRGWFGGAVYRFQDDSEVEVPASRLRFVWLALALGLIVWAVGRWG